MFPAILHGNWGNLLFFKRFFDDRADLGEWIVGLAVICVSSKKVANPG
jgi:hypothetical protein